MPWGARIGPDIAGGQHRGSVHLPDHGLTAVALPQDVGLAVAIEILRALDVPRRSEIGTDIGVADERQPVHRPDSGLAAVVLPEDIGLAVAVEIPGAFDMP